MIMLNTYTFENLVTEGKLYRPSHTQKDHAIEFQGVIDEYRTHSWYS